MKTMAEVIAAHRDIAWNHETKRSICGGCEADFGPMTAHMEQQDAWLIAHQADALSAAGFGPVQEARAQALRDAADELTRMDRIAATPVNQVTAEEEADYVKFINSGGDINWLRARAETAQ